MYNVIFNHRVKSMDVIGSRLVVASTDGYIKLYDIEFEVSDLCNAVPLASYSCLVLFSFL